MSHDTTVMEYTAEDLIAHKLQRAGLLVAKPKFDQDGADLLALLDVKDNAKFCRIQCKGRSLQRSPTSSVLVPKKYVSDGFVLFLFVETGDRDMTHLFCLLGREIRAHWTERDDQFVLNLTASKLTTELAEFIFDDGRIGEIIKTIINMNVSGEFHTMNHGYGELSFEPMVVSGGTFPASPTTTAVPP